MLALFIHASLAAAQPAADTERTDRAPTSGAATGGEDAAAEPPTQVAIRPTAADDQIADRLKGILRATNWFKNADVTVDEGVAFISGEAATEENKVWATELARSTEDVVAVVNRMAIDQPSPFDLTPARDEVDRLVRDTLKVMPAAVVALVLVVLTYWLSWGAWKLAGYFASRRLDSSLLQQLVARLAAVPVAILGLYLALRVSGLTRLAATVLGGTGVAGIVIGIAFRDIAENYLASLLISVKRPFRMGDLIQVDGNKGYVQSVTTRGTLLMTLDGNHIQIPNSVIYKSVIQNFTANPNTRFDFIVGVDYADEISAAQDVVLRALARHPAVLADPEPLVLVDELAASTINLQVLFWVETQQHSGLKVRSAVIRRVKQALDDAGFTLPDESREVLFPQGVPVVRLPDTPTADSTMASRRKTTDRSNRATDEADATPAEGNLTSEREVVRQQAVASTPPDLGDNLIAT